MTKRNAVLLASVLLASHICLVDAWNPLDFIRKVLPCSSLVLSRPEWTTSYFEPSILPPAQQNVTQERIVELVASRNLTCDSTVPTGHTLLCSPQGFTLLSPRKARFAIVFLHGITPAENEPSLLPTLIQILATNPELAPYIRIDFPLYFFRRITFSEFNDPPIPIARSYFNLLPPPKSTSLEDVIAAETDRLGLYRASQFVDFNVRSQMCKASIPSTRVLLMGHSLGAFTVLETVMATGLDLAGAISISGSVARAGDYVQTDALAFDNRPRRFNVTMIHGTADDIVPLAFANLSSQVFGPVFTSLGGGFSFVPLEGLDHFTRIFSSPKLYAAVRIALRNAFLRK